MIHRRVKSPALKLVRLAAVLAVTAGAGCRPSAPPVITQVELTLKPADGRAWVSFDTNGVAKGGHFSGDNPPFVHMDSALIVADSVRAIFAAARAIGDSLLSRRGPMVDSSRVGTATLAVTFSDSTQVQFVWTYLSQGPAAVQPLLDHIRANRVGGW